MRFAVLLLLQIVQVALLLLHDWVPLGRLNDLAAVRREHSTRALLVGTAVSSALPAVGLVLSVAAVMSGWPRWIDTYLLAAYGFLFVGEIEAWWVPYFFWPQPERAASYLAMFGSTHAFLPARNGIRPNTLHCVLHFATLVTLLLLIS